MNMDDSAVFVLDQEDPFIRNIADETASLKRSSRNNSPPSWDLNNTDFFLDLVLEQEIPPVEPIHTGEITQQNYVGATNTINSPQMLPVQPLDVPENPSAIPQIFFLCATPKPQGPISGYHSPGLRTRKGKMCDEFHDFYVNNSISDKGRNDSDPQSRRWKLRRYEEEPSVDPDHERSRRNAIIAKRNREKKKILLEEQQVTVDRLTKENLQFGGENYQLRRNVAFLEKEMQKLKNSLLSEISLSSLLLSIQKKDQFKFEEEFSKLIRDQ